MALEVCYTKCPLCRMLFMLSVAIKPIMLSCHCAECCFSECRYAQCHGPKVYPQWIMRKLTGDNVRIICLGQVFSSKLNSFARQYSKCMACMHPLLDLKTLARFSHFTCWTGGLPMILMDGFCREPLLKGKDQRGWPPCTSWLRSALLYKKYYLPFLQNKLP